MLRGIIGDIKTLIELNYYEAEKENARGRLSDQNFGNLKTRYRMSMEFYMDWNNYTLDNALKSVSPILIDMKDIGNKSDNDYIKKKEDEILDVFQRNGYKGKHPTWGIPIKLH